MSASPSSSELLDRARVGREVAMLAALCLIQTKGDPDAALELLDFFSTLPEADPDVLGELDVRSLAAQAIRDAVGLRA